MFAPGLFTGELIRWFGEPAVILLGCVSMIVHSAIALSGVGRWHFGIALMFSGVGWNFMFVAGSSLLVAALPDKPQPDAAQTAAKSDRATAVDPVATATPPTASTPEVPTHSFPSPTHPPSPTHTYTTHAATTTHKPNLDPLR